MDRPGIGLSSPASQRKLLDWADDIKKLVDHLGIKTFSVCGHSSGGPHALVVAHKLASQVRRAATIASVVLPASVGQDQNPGTFFSFAHLVYSRLGMLG